MCGLTMTTEERLTFYQIEDLEHSKGGQEIAPKGGGGKN